MHSKRIRQNIRNCAFGQIDIMVGQYLAQHIFKHEELWVIEGVKEHPAVEPAIIQPLGALGVVADGFDHHLPLQRVIPHIAHRGNEIGVE